MLYYVALIWNTADQTACASARSLREQLQRALPHWKTPVDEPGMTVSYDTAPGQRLHVPYFLQGGQGVVLGRMFDRGYVLRDDTHIAAPPPVVLDSKRAATIVASGGRDLVENYWGRYIAFIRDAQSRRCYVLRDPSGGVPCQRTMVRGVDVYFVRLEDCETLGPVSFSINTHYLLSYILNIACGRETGLNEVETVLAGECIAHDGSRRDRQFYWNPIEISERQVVERPDEARALLRTVTRGCVHAWSSCFDRITLELSGGLDSSIVASCLAAAPTRPRVRCHNLYSLDPGSDERVFARKAAERAGFPLTEEQVQTRVSLQPALDILRVPFPYPWWMRDTATEQPRAGVHVDDCDAMFSGEGGDEVFHSGGVVPAAVDFAWHHGYRPGLFSVVRDDAVIDGVSIWRILRTVHTLGIQKRPWHLRSIIHGGYRPLISAQVKIDAARDPGLWHPLYQDASPISPGKYAQAYMFTYGSYYIHISAETARTFASVAPLSAQPLLELSLRIPLHLMRAGGQDRALARKAFASDIPPEIVLRKSKAFGTSNVEEIFARNIRLVRELMLDGILVREGLLDRLALERLLQRQLTSTQSGLVELCNYMSVEGWARSWTGIPRREAA